MCSVGISRPIPRTEKSAQVKIARKFNAIKHQMRNLDGLYEVLAPGSTVGKISPTTSIIKEPKKPLVQVRHSDNTKFGKKEERFTRLAQNVDRHPLMLTENTLKQKITNHKDLLRKISAVRKS